MANVNIGMEKTYSLHMSGLSEYQVKFLAGVFQNSPMGYHMCDEPEEEAELRKAIFDKCRQVLNG